MKTDFRRTDHLTLGQNLIATGSHYQGFLELANAYTLVSEETEKERFKNELASLAPDPKTLADVKNGIDSQIYYIDRILGIGEVFQSDEVDLILLKRLDINRVLRLLVECYNLAIAVDTDSVDSIIDRKFAKRPSKSF